MFLSQVALVSDTSNVTMTQLTRVAAALQKQATRDLAPLWNINCTVDAFKYLEDVPLGYWPIIVAEDIAEDALGVHLDEHGQPYSLVRFSDSWSLTASHECMEMLVDPFGNRLVPGMSPKPGQGWVEFLVEVCDPCESAQCAYEIGGILVSDFYLPDYFSANDSQGQRYSFTGSIEQPLEVLPGGYLTWHDPADDHWWQLRYFGVEPEFKDLGILQMSGSLRATIDQLTPLPEIARGLPKENRDLLIAQASWHNTASKSEARAKALRRQMRGTSKAKNSKFPAYTG